MRIAYTGIFRFPTGDAGAARVLGIAQALRYAGQEVVFFGLEKQARIEDRQEEGSYQYQGFTYVPPSVKGNSQLARLQRLWGQSTGSLMLNRIKNWGLSRFDAVIAYQASSPLLFQLKKLCQDHGVACLCDVVEWYDPNHALGGALGPFRWDSELRMRVVQPEIGWIIAISSYLESYYQNRGCRSIRVPTLLNLDDPLWRPADSMACDGSMRFVYAGQPGKKDLLGNILKGASIARHSGLNVVSELVGVTRQQLQVSLGPSYDNILRSLGQSLVLHPRVQRTEVPSILGTADFVPLLRPDRRFSHAGFPTKIVEALSLGVPVICNLTSDLGLYLKDGYNAILCENESSSAFASALLRAASLKENWPLMRDSARCTAEQHFDYRKYVTVLNKFIEEAVVEARSRHSRRNIERT